MPGYSFAEDEIVSEHLIRKIMIRETVAHVSVSIVEKILTGRARMAAAICLMSIVMAFAQAQSTIPAQGQASSVHLSPVQNEVSMTKHAKGAFDVKVTPQKPDSKEAEMSKLGRMSLDKQFHGDLEATSTGEMLAAMTEVKGSAGYVAMERVNGTLQGKSGTFVLQHLGTMTRGVPQLNVTVVPDSGTDGLVGLAGSMTIKIEEGKHFYEFDYTLPAAQ
jgi:hypothetical protein